MYKIFPSVAHLKVLSSNVSTFNEPLRCFISSDLVSVFQTLEIPYQLTQVNPNLLIASDPSLKEQGYSINITNQIIQVKYKDKHGFFYAMHTLKQLIKHKEIKDLEIIDYPDILVRGYMLDISRDKVPTLKTIKEIVDLMTELKMNQLQLYVEGFSYEYQSFKQYLTEDGYVTINEYLEIEKYCNDRLIDLVPNQNGFGHMAKWLALEEFKDLAVAPDGIFLWGRNRKPTTLDPLDPRSVELVKKMYADMIPHFKSDYFNMNFDEPFELGHGKSSGMDICSIYIDYTLKLYEEVKKYQKIPQIWADVLIKHPESWDRLPKDMIFIDWGYDAFHPFDKHAKMLNEKNVKYMLAPGTTSWCSFLGRYSDWYENIKSSIDAVYLNNGLGVLTTDWGDFGHLQFLPTSFPPLVFMGLYSYRRKTNTILEIRDYLNKYVLKDKAHLLADILLDLSNNYRYENAYLGNGTRTFYTFMWAVSSIVDDKENALQYFNNKLLGNTLDYKRYKRFSDFFDLKLKELDDVLVEDPLIIEEIKLNIEIIRMIQKLSVSFDNQLNIKQRISYLEDILDKKDQFIKRQTEAWLARNKKGGLSDSLNYIECFIEFVSIKLNNLKEEIQNEKN